MKDRFGTVGTLLDQLRPTEDTIALILHDMRKIPASRTEPVEVNV